MPTSDRRSRLRFPLNADLRFEVLRRGPGKGAAGVGRVENISSKGLAFHTGTALERGQRLTISIAWPALLNERCLLRLTVEGSVIRTERTLAVVSIESYGFRTGGRSSPEARQELAQVATAMRSLVPANPA